MEPWYNALLGSLGGGAALATVALGMGLRRLEELRGVRFSRAQKVQAWLTIFGVFSAFSFFVMSLVRP